MPVSNKIRYMYQMVLFKGKRHHEREMKEIPNPKIKIPFARCKGAKIIIIHDIDNPGFEEELHEMIDMERERGVKSILMLLPQTMYYSKIFYSEAGMHETFPYKFKKNMKMFENLGVKVRSFSQHVAVKRTNFFPMILNKLPKEIEYMFVDPLSFGKKRSEVMFYKPKKYNKITLISVVSEPSKKTIDSVLNECSELKGTVAFNFHPDHLQKGDKMFSRSKENFAHLLKKLK